MNFLHVRAKNSIYCVTSGLKSMKIMKASDEMNDGGRDASTSRLQMKNESCVMSLLSGRQAGEL